MINISTNFKLKTVNFYLKNKLQSLKIKISTLMINISTNFKLKTVNVDLRNKFQTQKTSFRLKKLVKDLKN